MKEQRNEKQGDHMMQNETITSGGLRELTRMRACIYRMLASLYFKELSAEQVAFVAEQDFTGWEELDPHVAEGIRDMARALRHVHSGTREDLAIDYAHIFLGAGSTKHEKRAIPFESVYTSPSGLLMQDARDDVYRCMLEEHLAPDERLHIPEDHISFELEFMADLCDLLNAAIEAGKEDEASRLSRVQHDFHSDHLLVWIDDFCDATQRCCRTVFYGGVSKITLGFVHLDVELIAESVALLSPAA